MAEWPMGTIRDIFSSLYPLSLPGRPSFSRISVVCLFDTSHCWSMPGVIHTNRFPASASSRGKGDCQKRVFFAHIVLSYKKFVFHPAYSRRGIPQRKAVGFRFRFRWRRIRQESQTIATLLPRRQGRESKARGLLKKSSLYLFMVLMVHFYF